MHITSLIPSITRSYNTSSFLSLHFNHSHLLTVTGQFAQGQFAQKNEKIKLKKLNLSYPNLTYGGPIWANCPWANSLITLLTSQLLMYFLFILSSIFLLHSFTRSYDKCSAVPIPVSVFPFLISTSFTLSYKTAFDVLSLDSSIFNSFLSFQFNHSHVLKRLLLPYQIPSTKFHFYLSTSIIHTFLKDCFCRTKFLQLYYNFIFPLQSRLLTRQLLLYFLLIPSFIHFLSIFPLFLSSSYFPRFFHKYLLLKKIFSKVHSFYG